MPLYVHVPTGERKRTVPGKHEDLRVQMDPNWELVTSAALPISTIETPPESVAMPAVRPARTPRSD